MKFKYLGWAFVRVLVLMVFSCPVFAQSFDWKVGDEGCGIDAQADYDECFA
jgi:hypothetical protein